jgi:hypothetical protein
MINEKKLLLFSFLIGITYNILFFHKNLGISLFIFTVILIGFLIFLMRELGIIRKNVAWTICIPIILLSIYPFLSTNKFFIPFNVIIIGLLFILMSYLLLQKEKLFFDFKILKIACNILLYPIKYFLKPYFAIFSIFKNKRGDHNNQVVKKILLGLCISFPILLVIMMLLSSADMVFNNILSSIPSFIGFFTRSQISIINNSIAIFIITLIIATYLYCYGWNLFIVNTNSNVNNNSTPIKPKRFFDSTILITVLIMINLVYILFSIIQFSYLFGGGLNALPNGLTYSEYARHGFFELIFVSVINFAIILIALYFSDLKQKVSGIILKTLVFILGITTYIMAYSSYYRMNLYETQYGYTYLRVFVYFFLLLESILLLITLFYTMYSRFNLVKVCICTFLILYIGLNYINIDNVIAKKNVDRYFSTKKIDLKYLEQLSPDAIPQIKRLLNSNNMNIKYHTKLYIKRMDKALEKHTSWQEFNLNGYEVKKLLN